MIYTDRSRTVTRKECARMGWLQYDADGTGWVPQGTSLPLLNGIIIHNAFAELLVGADLGDVIAGAQIAYDTEVEKHRKGRKFTPQEQWLWDEQMFMVKGIIRAWAYFHLPRMMEEFDVATFPKDGKPFVEKEFEVEIGAGVSAMLRMDAVLRRKSTGELVIWDFKTAGYISDDWMQKWQHNPQTYLYTHALEKFMEEMGEEVEGIAYQGIVKGIRRTETAKVKWQGYKVQTTPYCYGYQGPDGTIELAYTPKKGWKKIAAWEVMDAKQWFEDVLKPAHWDNGLFDTLFSTVPPYSPVKWEVERWRQQVVWAEYLNAAYKQEIAEAKAAGDEGEAQRLLDIYYPTNEERCFKYGADNKCPYIPACFTQEPEMVELGFVKRVPHHDKELEEAA